MSYLFCMSESSLWEESGCSDVRLIYVYSQGCRASHSAVIACLKPSVMAGVEGALPTGSGLLCVLGIPCDVVAIEGVRYCMYETIHGFASVAYTKSRA